MYMSVFSLVNYQGVGGGCGLEFTSKNLGHTHCHIKGIWMQKTWGPPTPKGPRENTACILSEVIITSIQTEHKL